METPLSVLFNYSKDLELLAIALCSGAERLCIQPVEKMTAGGGGQHIIVGSPISAHLHCERYS